jgi:hypothetical protein
MPMAMPATATMTLFRDITLFLLVLGFARRRTIHIDHRPVSVFLNANGPTAVEVGHHGLRHWCPMPGSRTISEKVPHEHVRKSPIRGTKSPSKGQTLLVPVFHDG